MRSKLRAFAAESALYESSGEGAVDLILEGKRPASLGECERGDLDCDLSHDFVVLLGLEGAGAVDESAAGLQDFGCAAKERELVDRHADEVLLCKAPSDVNASAKDARI